MKRKMVVLGLATMLVLLCNKSYADNYYYYSPAQVIAYPIPQVQNNFYTTNNTYYTPRFRYRLVPVYRYELVKPAPVYGFSWLRHPVYQPVTEWQWVPVIR